MGSGEPLSQSRDPPPRGLPGPRLPRVPDVNVDNPGRASGVGGSSREGEAGEGNPHISITSLADYGVPALVLVLLGQGSSGFPLGAREPCQYPLTLRGGHNGVELSIPPEVWVRAGGTAKGIATRPQREVVAPRTCGRNRNPAWPNAYPTAKRIPVVSFGQVVCVWGRGGPDSDGADMG